MVTLKSRLQNNTARSQCKTRQMCGTDIYEKKEQ
jgi:positive regulator of sigma E activity